MAFPRLRQELCDLDRLRLIGLGHAGTLTNQAGRAWKIDELGDNCVGGGT